VVAVVAMVWSLLQSDGSPSAKNTKKYNLCSVLNASLSILFTKMVFSVSVYISIIWTQREVKVLCISLQRIVCCRASIGQSLGRWLKEPSLEYFKHFVVVVFTNVYPFTLIIFVDFFIKETPNLCSSKLFYF